MFSDTALEHEVRNALEHDTRISHVEQIAVYADKLGSVTLRGAVGSLGQRLAAVHDARQIDGVANVIDELKIHPRVGDRSRDDEIRALALQRLIDDPRTPANHIDVKVSQGRATLKGYVWHESQRAAAVEDVASLEGIVDVTDEIVVE
jgi:osmotically-inducible protein OsmY